MRKIIFRLSVMLMFCSLIAIFYLPNATQPSANVIPTTEAYQSTYDLTGTWAGDDGATYQVRQVGDVVWWLGLSKDNGRSFTNVFQGRRVGDVITGAWADVPNGNNTGTGYLELTALRAYRYTVMTKRSQTGNGFGATAWRKIQRRPAEEVAQPGGSATILEDGSVKITRPDGSATIYMDGRTINIAPDGTQSGFISHNVQAATPPMSALDSTANLKSWIEQHNKGLLDAIGRLLSPAEKDAALNNLLRAEGQKNYNVFQRADFRTGAIFKLRGQ